MALGVERVEGRKLAEGSGRRSDVLALLVRSLLLAVLGLVVGVGAEPGVQLDPGLGERVVRQQRSVGQHVEGVLAPQLVDQVSQREPVALEFAHLLFGVADRSGIGLDLLDPLPGLVAFAAVLVDLPLEVVERLLVRRSDARLVGLEPRGQPLPTFARQRGGEAGEEAREQNVAVLGDVGQESSGELLTARRAENQARLAGDWPGRVVVARPVIHAPGRELPPEHRDRAQEHPRGLDVPIQHLHRIGVEVQVVRLRRGQDEHHRVAGPAARAPDALEVVGRRRGDAAQHRRRQVADVDPHLERGGGDQQVGCLRILGGRATQEPALQLGAVRAAEQPRVLSGEDPRCAASAVDGGVVAGHRLDPLQAGRRSERPGDLPFRLLRLREGDVEDPAAMPRLHRSDGSGQREGLGGQTPDVDPGRAPDARQHTRLGQRAQGLAVDARQGVRPRLGPVQAAADPIAEPAGVGAAPERGLEDVSLGAGADETDPLGARAHRAHVRVLALVQQVAVAVGLGVALEEGVVDCAHVAHPVQQTAKEVGGVRLGVRLALLPVPATEAGGRALDAVRIDADGRCRRLLEAAADAGGHAELPRELPAEALAQDPPDALVLALAGGLDVAQVLGQLSQVVGQERGEVSQVAQRRAPVVLEGLGSLVQGQRVVCFDHGLHGGPQVNAEGAAAEEARAVAGVLHRVGEGEELLVVVERALEELGDRHGREAGGPGADDGQGVVGAAGRATGREALVLPVLFQGPLDQHGTAARLALAVGGHGAVQGGRVGVQPVHQLRGAVLPGEGAGPHEARVAVALHPRLTHYPGRQRDPSLLAVALGAHGSDAVDAALPAVGLRGVEPVGLGLAGDVGPPGEADGQQRAVLLVGQRPEQAGEFAAPQLHLNREERTESSPDLAPGVAHEGQEAGQQPQPGGRRDVQPPRHPLDQRGVHGIERRRV